jgi:hypothetical protein
MADPTFVLLIILGTSPAERLHGDLVSGAIVDSLGRDARVLVEDRVSAPNDGEAATTVDRVRASAVAEVSWTDGTHTHARLHVYLAADRTWYDRDLAFDAVDAADERERAVGLLVGAMIREAVLESPPPATSPAVRTTPPRVESSSPARPPDVVERPPPARPSRFAVDVGAMAMGGIDGDAGALGPSLSAHTNVLDPLSVHVSGAFGFGTIAAANATTTTTRIAAGGHWLLFTLARDLSFFVGVEALAVHHAVRRADPAADRDRWLGGGHADLGLGWRVSSVLEPFARGGVDAVAGKTPITVGGQTLAQIPPFRAVGEAGLRLHF